jgi:hypothetical protein
LFDVFPAELMPRTEELDTRSSLPHVWLES